MQFFDILVPTGITWWTGREWRKILSRKSISSSSDYAAQQNLYAAILQDCYGIELESMSLVQLHEARSSFVVVPIPKHAGHGEIYA